jgi:hypothetical protein
MAKLNAIPGDLALFARAKDPVTSENWAASPGMVAEVAATAKTRKRRKTSGILPQPLDLLGETRVRGLPARSEFP